MAATNGKPVSGKRATGTTTLKKQVSRDELQPGESLCDHCTAKCCKYFALPIDEPTTRRDYDFIRWYLLHERATVFTEDEAWYLLVHTACKHLQPNNLCGIYETRPQICREYSTRNCEYEDDWVYDRYFETPEQVEEYAEAVLPAAAPSAAASRPRCPSSSPMPSQATDCEASSAGVDGVSPCVASIRLFTTT